MRTPPLLVVIAVLGTGCPPSPPVCDQKVSEIHFNLAIEGQAHQDPRAAVHEVEEALRLCPTSAEAENLLGVLLHVSFQKREEAEHHFQAALGLKPTYSEAKVNLGNLYLDEDHCDRAIPLYEDALKDMFYTRPWFPLNNEGWCEHRLGDDTKALSLIAESVRMNPEFCQGYRNRGLIYFGQKNYEMADSEFEKLASKCPDLAESHYELARVMAAMKLDGPAQAEYTRCRDLSKEGDPLQDLCARAAGVTSTPDPPPDPSP